MYQWSSITQHHDGVEHGFNLELSWKCTFFPEVDECEYHYIRVTESGEIYGSTSDFMYICDNLTHLYMNKEIDIDIMYKGLKYVTDVGMFECEDITDEFRAYHAEQADNEE